MTDNIRLSADQLKTLQEESATPEVLNLQFGGTPQANYDEGTAASIFRRLLSGITGGGSEHYLQESAGVPPPQNNPLFAGSLAEMVGQGASFMAPQALAARGLGGLAASYPRIAKTAETALASGFQEAGVAGAEGENPISAALSGAALGAIPEAAFRSTGYLRSSMASPNSNALQKYVFDPVGLKKQGILPEREKLAELLENAGLSMPGALRPRDWFVDLVEAKSARSVSSRPYMQDTADRAGRVLDKFAQDTVFMIGPDIQTGLQVDNAMFGAGLRKKFEDRTKSIHDRASSLYNSVFKGEVGATKVDPTDLVTNLEGLIQHWGYDPKAALQEPGVSEIQAFINDLGKGAKSVELHGPDNELISHRDEVIPRELNWLNTRISALSTHEKRQWTKADLIKQDAAGTIRDFVLSTVDEISPEHAGFVLEARKQWKTYRELLRHPLAKIFMERDTASVVNQLFKSPDSIEQARGLLPPPVFELARQRWLANIVYSARKGTDIEEGDAISGVHYVLNASGLNSKLKQFGGIDGETLRAAFVDAPEKLDLIHQLQRVVSQASPSIRRYKGEAESPGGPEYAGLATIIRGLFTSITFPTHLIMTSRAARSVTAPQPINPFLGGIAPPSKLDEPFIRGIASNTLR